MTKNASFQELSNQRDETVFIFHCETFYDFSFVLKFCNNSFPCQITVPVVEIFHFVFIHFAKKYFVVILMSEMLLVSFLFSVKINSSEHFYFNLEKVLFFHSSSEMMFLNFLHE